MFVVWVGLLSNKYQGVLCMESIIDSNRYHQMLYTNTVVNFSESLKSEDSRKLLL